MVQLKVFYDERMIATQKSPSPSSYKPREVVNHWLASPLKDRIEIVKPRAVTYAEICNAHHHEYVKGILDLTEPNGFGSISLSVAESLPWTNGAMVDAAFEAHKTKKNTCAPVSGFHHAHWDRAEGFCTFNGLMIATRLLLGEPSVKRVGILDCDMHWGNGTEDIIDHVWTFGLHPARGSERFAIIDHVWTFGLHPARGSERFAVAKDGAIMFENAPIRHYSFGSYYDGTSEPDDVAEDFLTNLPKVVEAMADCGVILYQAGADPHVDDPYGGLLTDAQLRERDRIVFTVAKRIGVPIAWNLAGGYRYDKSGGISPVLETHYATLQECLLTMEAP